MDVSVVIPCLNEEKLLAYTCESLGFGGSSTPEPDGITLVLVDNGSVDRTPEIMARIRDRSPAGRVLLAQEWTRGYVPARHRGVLAVREKARVNNIPERDVLILQGDADTLYRPGYVAAMRNAARGESNVLLHGVSTAPPEFDRSHPGYGAVMAKVDHPLQKFYVQDTQDVVVSDNVCGYFLSDYFAWGGHVREYNKAGEEIYAETSRLLVKARLLGAHSLKVAEAVANHSRRKIIANPILQFATAGFPREASWCLAWNQAYSGPNTLEAFEHPDIVQEIREAIFVRRAHSLLLFGLMPICVAVLVDETSSPSATFSELHSMLAYMKVLSRNDILKNTATFFERAFKLLESQRYDLVELVR
jgi:hypothetical protein